MSRYIWKSVLLLTLSIVICYGLYPLSSWVIGKAAFSSQPNSSMLSGHDSRIVDSRQIAEPTPKDEYFQPRPAAASYDASGSTSSANLNRVPFSSLTRPTPDVCTSQGNNGVAWLELL